MKRRALTIALAVLLAVLGTVGVLAYVNEANARALAGQQAVTVLIAPPGHPGGYLRGRRAGTRGCWQPSGCRGLGAGRRAHRDHPGRSAPW